MFWKKSSGTQKLPGPKSIEEVIGRQLVLQLKKDPDWVWPLKSVARPNLERGKKAFDFRVFNQGQVSAKKVNVKDYNSLNDYPELILFEGWYDKETMQAHFEKQNA